MALTKVAASSLFDVASVASNTVSVGPAKDVAAYYLVEFRVRMGRATASAFTVGPIFRLEKTLVVSPTADDWAVVASFQALVGASIGSTAVSGTEAAGQTVVSLTSGTNFTARDYVFFHNTTIANSEWSRIVSVATNDITLEEGLVRAQTGATARDQAEHYTGLIDVTGVQKLRLVADNAGTGQAVVVMAEFAAVSGL